MALVMSVSSALAWTYRSVHDYNTSVKVQETHDGNDNVSVLSRLLELVELSDGADDSLHSELVREALRLLR